MRQVSVADVVSALGPHLVLATTGDLDAVVSHVQTTDPSHPQPVEPGAVVLAAGYVPGTDAWDALVAQAPAAVVVKGAPAPSIGCAAVALNPVADWGQVAALVRTAVSAVEPSVSLVDLADSIAALCGGAVVMHDASWHLLAYSGGQPQEGTRNETLHGRRAPQAQVEQLVTKGYVATLAKGAVVHVPPDAILDLGERYAVGVTVGGEYLGSIWLLPPDGVAAAELEQALLRAADVVALPFLREATSDRNREAERDAALESLLNGGATGRVVGERLGVPVDGGFVLAGLRPLAGDGAERVAATRRLHTHVRTYLDAYRSNAAVAAVGETLYVLLPSADLDGRIKAVRLVTDLHTRLTKMSPHRAMISSRYAMLVETAATRGVVDELLSLSERRGWASLTDSESVQASWRLQQFREVALAHPALLQGPVLKVVEYDQEQGGDLLDTLRHWFEAVGDARLAAERMGLHVNTVRYRLKRIEEIAGFTLDNPDERLLAELQVRLLLGD